MRRITFRALAILGLLVLSSHVYAMSSQSKNYRQYFDIDLPPGFSVAAESPVEDFVLFRFSDKGRVVLTVYVGNAPDRSMLSKKASVFTAEHVQIVSLWKQGSLSRRDWIIQRCATGWPQYIHAFTGERPLEGDKLASSISVRPFQTICGNK